jgi:hypothetical protein
VWLVVTDRRVLLFESIAPAAPAYWQAARNLIAAIERRARLQQMARFRMHFTDGSSAAFMTRFAADVRALNGEIAPRP